MKVNITIEREKQRDIYCKEKLSQTKNTEILKNKIQLDATY